MTCIGCDETIAADGLNDLGLAFLRHVRAAHVDMPYSDMAIRNFAEATQRLTGPGERLDRIEELEVHPVTDDRIDDWLHLFDHDGFVGWPQWAACYCTEPHVAEPGAEDEHDAHWTENRHLMVDRLREGRTSGYLGYVGGRPAAWVNASLRSEYALYRAGPGSEPSDESVVGISCFVVAPPYRRHGVAGALLDRVLADAAGRGAAWVEAYPFLPSTSIEPQADFRGPRALYDARGFEQVAERARDVVVRRRPASTS
ncbi:GNAT family N-acetyltransferase [Actinomarinicola tropica]|nr:GNAT family N-acetyltransferase [Actinomarinicola tropica]